MSRISLNLKKVTLDLPAEKLPQDGQRIVSILENSYDPNKRIVLEFEHEKEPWVKDMNQQYQKVMSTIITLATSALILPTFFMRELLDIEASTSIIKELLKRKFWGIGLSSWIFFSLSILCALLFFYFSANRIKDAWGATVEKLFWIRIKNRKTIRCWLYVSFNFSVVFFLLGIGSFILFALKTSS